MRMASFFLPLTSISYFQQGSLSHLYCLRSPKNGYLVLELHYCFLNLCSIKEEDFLKLFSTLKGVMTMSVCAPLHTLTSGGIA